MIVEKQMVDSVTEPEGVTYFYIKNKDFGLNHNITPSEFRFFLCCNFL